MNKEKQLEEILFEIYEKGVNQEDCNLSEHIEQIRDILSEKPQASLCDAIFEQEFKLEKSGTK